jgi:acetoin utilization deacetylase AcuC-like enzyme
MSLGLITHRDCRLHNAGELHPECPARLDAISDQIIASGIEPFMRHYDAPLATREQLERVHTPDYVQHIFNIAPTDQSIHLDPDTVMCPATLQAALRAAGAVIYAVDLVMQGDINTAFCSVRPPGHHAEHDKAMGFCIFNNIAVGVAHALAEYKLERVAIVDFDVHHGNGTEDIFKDEPRVLLCSSFQHPFYPYTEFETSQPDNIYHMPMEVGSGSQAFKEQMTEHCFPVLETFKPELIFISAGFDAHIEDDMSNIVLVDDDYQWVTQQIMKIAKKYSNGRVISALEGGYALSALGRSVVKHLKALMD